MIHKILSKTGTGLSLVVTYCLNALSHLTPRSKRIWVFIGWHLTVDGEVFTDNCKYFYLHVANKEKEITPIWLAKSKNLAEELRRAGYKAHYEKSVLGIYYALRAGVTCIDAYLQPFNFRFVGKTKLVQLLHGKGIKASGYGLKSIRKFDYIFCSSESSKAMLGSHFTIGAKVLIAGYSRAEAVLHKDIPGSQVHVNTSEIERLTSLRKKGTKIIWYSPTFRRGEKSFNAEEKIDLSNLLPILEEHNLHLCISRHPKYRNDKNITCHPTVSYIETQDMYPLYRYFDLLVTDYSSTFTEFMLLNRPIVFYPYDLEKYVREEGVLIDYKNEMPGAIAYNAKSLIKTIIKEIELDTYSDKRNRICDKFFAYRDGCDSNRIYEKLKSDLSI